MATTGSDTNNAPLPEEDLIEKRMRLKRNVRCPCSGCRGLDPLTGLDVYRKKIETNLEMKKR
jgi:hypothetical protein